MEELAKLLASFAALLTAVTQGVVAFRSGRTSSRDGRTIYDAIKSSNLSKETKETIGNALRMYHRFAVMVSALSILFLVSAATLIYLTWDAKREVVQVRERIRWEANWRIIKGGYSSAVDDDGSVLVSRHETLAALSELDLSTNPELQQKRLELVASVKSGQIEGTGDGVRVESSFHDKFRELRRMIMEQAIKYGAVDSKEP